MSSSFPDQSDPEIRIKTLILKSDQKWSWWIWSICRYWSENGSKRSKLDQKWPLKDHNKMIRKTLRIFDPGFLRVYWQFFKNFSQKVNNPKWPLDHLWPQRLKQHPICKGLKSLSPCCTPPKAVPIFSVLKYIQKIQNCHFRVFIMIRISETHFLKEYVRIHQMGSHFVGGYQLNFPPTEQETKTSILQAFGPQ